MQKAERRLSAILAADAAGYSRLMEADEAGTLAAFKRHSAELIDPGIADYGGRIVKRTGDGLLVEFPSVVHAVECAVLVQQGMAERNRAVASDRRMDFRIGINLGDIIADGADIFGDGVNIAARLQELAAPGGICVSRAALDQVAGKVAVAFEDLGALQLKNIALPVHVFRIATERGPAPETADSPPSLIADRPSIAVLPFGSLSGDRSLDLLAEGLVEDIVTLLARIPGFFVIARSSSGAYKNRSLDVRQVGRELGVRYVVEGSVRALGSKVRVSAQLIDAQTGKNLWVQRFEVDRAATLDLQDDIARGIIAELEPELTRAELTVIRRQRPENLDVWGHYRQGLAATALRGWSEESIADGIREYERAIALDPRFALAQGHMALLMAIGVTMGLVEDNAALRRRVIDAAENAAALDADNSDVLGYAGCALADIGETQRGLDMLERAVERDPSNAQARVALGATQALRRDFTTGIENMRLGMRLSPRDYRLVFWGALLAVHLARAGHLEEALTEAMAASRRDARFYGSRVATAMILARLDRRGEAKTALAEARRMRPRLTLREIEGSVGRRGAADLKPLWDELEAERVADNESATPETGDSHDRRAQLSPGASGPR